MKIAIVGSGISGLVAAHLLRPRHQISVFESDARVGGHTHTVNVEYAGERHAVDTGFIVYNETTYPELTRLFAKLGVETQPSEMSFGLHCERSGREWSSRGLGGVFAQPSNLMRPSFHRMLRDVLRFNREAPRLLERLPGGLPDQAGGSELEPDGVERGEGEIGELGEKVALGDYLQGAGYSAEFVEHYVIPMGAAVWSADPEGFLRMPATTFVRFFRNHGLLEANPSLPWRVVCGGSSCYVEKLVEPFRPCIRTGCAVRGVRRTHAGVEITSAAGVERFDHVILALHSDQALGLLRDATPLERHVLGAIAYQPNDVALHTDVSLLPRRQRAWASWNYRVPREPQGRVLVTYDMTRLQRLASRHRFLVTLNGTARIDPSRILGRFVYHHPVFDAGAIEAQRLHARVSGRQRTHFCGAYWGHGFHEDGVKSALAVCARFGEES